MRTHSIQDNLQKSDIISRLQQNMQEPARVGTAEVSEKSDVRQQQVAEQAQEVPESENKIVEEDRRREPFARRRRKRRSESESEAADDRPQAPGHEGLIDLTA